MKRRGWLILVLLIWIISGSVVAAFATRAERDYQLRGYVDATTDINLPYRVPRLGVNAELTQYSTEELPLQLDLMVAANIHWVRQFVRWDEIEPADGQYDWDYLDRIIPIFVDYPDLSLVPVLVNSPGWARPSDDPTAPPDTAADYADFVTAFAERYGDYIEYYQVWDEPNIRTGWGDTDPNAIEYSVLLQSAYTAIHAADSDAQVIAAALAPTVESGPQNVSDVLYLEQLYDLGLPEFADVVAGKPYGFDSPAFDRDVDPQRLNFSRIILLREVMERHGDGQRPLWASNWGWNSLPEAWSGDASLWGSVDEAQQNQYTQDALNRVDEEWPWLGAMILQHWQPQADADNPIWGFSALDTDGEPKPLYNLLVSIVAPEAATNGLYPAENEYARYSGIWEFSDLGADMGWVKDSYFEFDFAGEAIALVLRRGDYVGYLYPTIEDYPVNLVPDDVAGNPYISLRSGDLETHVVSVPVSDGLIVQPKTLSVVTDELVPDEVTNRWPLVGYAVSSGDLARSYNQQITIAWITAIISGLAAFATVFYVDLSVLQVFAARFRILINNGLQIVIGVIASAALMFGTYLIYSDSVPHWFRRDSVQLGLSIATSGIVYLNPGALLTILALTVLFVLFLNRVELGLALIIFWAPFFLFPVELFQFFFPTAELLFYVTLAAWLARWLIEMGKQRRGNDTNRTIAVADRLSSIDFMVIFWIVLGVFAALHSEHRSLAVTELRTLFIQPGLFYVILRTMRQRQSTQVFLLDALVLSGVVVSIAGLFMWIDGNIIQAEGGTLRLQGVYGSPNNVALLLGRILPFLLAMWFVRLDRVRKIYAALSLLIVFPALLLTQSAGALFVGVPASMAAMVWVWLRKKAIVPLVVLALLFGAGLVLASQSPRFERMTHITEGTNFYRIRVWQSTLNILEDQPIKGVGLDQFLYVFREQYMMPDAWEEPDLSHPHNIFLDFWTRLGLPGLVFLVTLIAIIAKRLLALSQTQSGYTGFKYMMILGLVGSFVNLLMHGMIDNSIYVLDLVYIFMLLLFFLVNLPNIGAIDAA